VTAVSSFWGNPPSAQYHPLQLVGGADCSDAGECNVAFAWEEMDEGERAAQGEEGAAELASLLAVGQRVAHRSHAGALSLLARVTGVNSPKGHVSLEYFPLYKRPDGSAADGPGPLRQCHMDVRADGSYPEQCLFALVPPSGVLNATVPLWELAGPGPAVWSPVSQGGPHNRTVRGGGAFGPEFAFEWNQADHYPPHTEFVEFTIATAVFVMQVEVGMPRGMGHIVSIKLRDPAGGRWYSLYAGAPLTGLSASETRRYWRWAPDVCRPHFKSAQLRLEVDTSSATGFGDWTYIDYVQVFGSASIQDAALPSGTTGTRACGCALCDLCVCGAREGMCGREALSAESG